MKTQRFKCTLKMIAERCQKSRKFSRGGNNRGGKRVRKPPKGEKVNERVKKFRSTSSYIKMTVKVYPN